MPWRSHLGRPTTVACDVLGLAELEKLRGSGTAYYPPTMLLGGFWFCPYPWRSRRAAGYSYATRVVFSREFEWVA